MPDVIEVEARVDEIVRVYRQAWEDIVAETLRVLGDPTRGRRRQRLAEMRRMIEAELDRLDAYAREWMLTRFPEIYAFGAQAGATAAGAPLTGWTQLHHEAINRLAVDAFEDVLEATRYVRRDIKRLIREVGKLYSELSVSTDRTAQGAARQLARFLEQRGLAAVTYRNGARHGLGEYSEMLIRTKSGIAYNEGTFNAGSERGIMYYEVFDGPDCGWSFHEDTQLAAGMIVTENEGREFPISHPNCRRGFGARPDIVTARDRDRALGGQVTTRQVAAQRSQDQARLARQQRRSQRRRRESRSPRS